MKISNTSLFLDLLKGEKVSRPPIWFMRQAGRCLPSYRKLREQFSFEELLTNPDLAAKVTVLPIEELGVDAAILFSDITIIANRLNLTLKFPEGKPQISPNLSNFLDSPKDFLKKLKVGKDFFTQSAAQKSIALLPKSIPLIGFCGGPLSTFFYLFRDTTLSQTEQINIFVRWLLCNENLAQSFFDIITQTCKILINDLAQCGIKIFQIFETHADMVSWDFYSKNILPWTRSLISSVKENKMYCSLFAKGAGLGNMDLVKESIDVLSIDWQTPLDKIVKIKNDLYLQGNIDPRMIQNCCIQNVISICKKNWILSKKSLIVNLGHGVLPDTDSNLLKKLCTTLQEYNWDN